MISVIVPVYGHGRSLDALCTRVEATFKRVYPLGDFEIIFVDDCSGGEVFDDIKRLADTREFVRGVRLKFNAGQQNATYCGMHLAMGEIIVTLDDDLQHEPELVPAMISKLSEDVDLVYGVTVGRKYEQHRQIGSKLTARFFRKRYKVLKGKRVSSFRVFKKSLSMQVVEKEFGFIYLSCLLLEKCSGVENLTIPFIPRAEGKSNYSLVKLVRLYGGLVLNYGPFRKLYRAYFKKKVPCFEVAEEIGGKVQGVNSNENYDAGRRNQSAMCN